MKRCPGCERVLPMEEFHRNARKADGRQSHCRDCKRRHYEANRERYYVSIKRSTLRTRATNRTRVAAYLREHACVDCGESDPAVLEFDHVRGVNRTAISVMVYNGFSWASIAAEIAKCEVRCANCHRRRTARVRVQTRVKREGEPRLL